MKLTICDRCSKVPFSIAAYRVTFQRLEYDEPYNVTVAGATSDRPIDLCQRHYDDLWKGYSQ